MGGCDSVATPDPLGPRNWFQSEVSPIELHANEAAHKCVNRLVNFLRNECIDVDGCRMWLTKSSRFLRDVRLLGVMVLFIAAEVIEVHRCY